MKIALIVFLIGLSLTGYSQVKLVGQKSGSSLDTAIVNDMIEQALDDIGAGLTPEEIPDYEEDPIYAEDIPDLIHFSDTIDEIATKNNLLSITIDSSEWA